ncbi:hypothetical protein [Acinetobacter tianfuensis]|uniref:hypothetical protein n=1 Tax=Acinetobacter tianfuensis TaxID=2419603 RepID=UPI001D17DAE5|nr:hypothetical protein [Acinetobacter tianfuensis]
MKCLGLLASSVLMLHGCASLGHLGADPMTKYSSVQSLIAEQQLHNQTYIYAWGAKSKQNEPQTMMPRAQLAKYCHANGGSFSLYQKSNLPLIKSSKIKNTLAANRNITQAAGSYQCVKQKQQLWVVSIEPTAELKSPQDHDARAVRMNVELMSAYEAKQLYKNAAASAAVKKSAAVPAAKTAVKTQNTKEQKAAEDKKEQPAAQSVRAAADTPQQKQMELYVSARRDINNGKNLNNACNNAQRAYNYGKLQGTDGTRVYTESGMLVARCLTSISTYSSRFPNAKGQAKRILQNLAVNYNHSGAKHMLKQLG